MNAHPVYFFTALLCSPMRAYPNFRHSSGFLRKASMKNKMTRRKREMLILWHLALVKLSVAARLRRSRSGSITVVILFRCTYIDTESNTPLANRKASHAATNALTTESFYGNLTGAFFSGHPEVRKRLRLSTVYWMFLNEGVPLDPECDLPGLQSDTSCSVYATVSCKIIDVL